MTDGYKIKRILVGTQQVRPAGWKPGENTLLYLPLENNITDYSGKNRTTTPSNVTYGTKGGVQCAIANGSNSKIAVGPNGFIDTTMSNCTVSMWIYVEQSDRRLLEFAIQNTNHFTCDITSNNDLKWFVDGSTQITTTVTLNSWVNVIITGNSSKMEMYINGIKTSESPRQTPTRGSRRNSYQQGQNIFASRDAAGDFYQGGMRELILEDKVRTAQEISAYYNQTKSNYSL